MTTGIVRRLFCLVLLFPALNAFAAGKGRDPDWQKRWWLEKTVRKLRGGEGLLPGENAEELLRLSKEDAVARFVADPRFANMVLDFNMFFLGFKADVLKNEYGFSYEIFDFPNAIVSARETAAGGDFFRLFDLEAQPFMEPLRSYPQNGQENLTEIEILRKRAAETQATIADLLAYVTKDPLATPEAACQRYFQMAAFGLNGLGVGTTFSILASNDLNYGLALQGACLVGPKPSLTELADYLQKIAGINAKLFPALESFAASVYRPTGLADLRRFDVTAAGFAPWIAWGFQQRIALPNSSTNYNRKRAAYVLKRFFCDDLTPIAVESPEAHARGGQHGSQTSCYACHYKLDPMAGYFRNRGLFFTDFSSYPILVFDDGAVVPRAAYEEKWKAKPGSAREWNVGYIRSVGDESLNDYGSTLEDLHALLKRAPEVRRCLARRAFEYMVSDKQTIDAGYLDYLTDEFSKRAEVNSSEGFKWLVSTLALSNSFNEPDLSPEECYDRRPGTVPGERPPCRVAFLFERNCAGCHSSTSGAGRLNLTGWTSLPDGTKTFPHLDRGGAQRPLRDTFERLNDRLTTRDESRRMPLGQFMTSQDRQELYLWVQEQLNAHP